MIDISYIDEIYPKLEDLILGHVAGTVDNRHMVMIQQHLPGLKTLDMEILWSVRPLTMNDTWLSCIRHIHYGDPYSTDLSVNNLKRPQPQGLASLSITPNNLFSLDDIAPFIIHHHARLHALELKSGFDTTQAYNMMEAMNDYQSIAFKQLEVLTATTLSAIDNVQPYSNFMSWVLERAPYLHSVELGVDIMTYSSMRSLGKCKNLRDVVLSDVSGEQVPGDHGTLVTEFVKAHVHYMADQGGSHLQSIRVRLQEAHPMLIDVIHELRRLTTFQLYTSNLESQSFVGLFESLRQGCEALTTLAIMSNDPVPNRVLYHVSGLPNLRRLVAGYLRDDQCGILSVQRCRHLEYLTSWSSIDQDIQSLLLECNPDLKITDMSTLH